MSAARLVLLDIGSTLIAGPGQSPAARFADRLALTDQQRQELNAALMTTAFPDADAVGNHLHAAFGVPAGSARQVAGELWDAQERDGREIPGARETLVRLRDSGVRLALISNIWRPYLTAVEAVLGDFFAAAIPPELRVYSFEQGRRKPAPELFRLILDRAGVDAAATVMVGDSYVEDVAPAIGLGLKTVWVLQRPEREAANVVRVLNGDAPSPTRAVSSIAALDLDLLETADLSRPRRTSS